MAARSTCLMKLVVVTMAIFGAQQAFLSNMSVQRPSRSNMELSPNAVQGAAAGMVTVLGVPAAAHAERFLGFIDWNYVWAANVLIAVGCLFVVPAHSHNCILAHIHFYTHIHLLNSLAQVAVFALTCLALGAFLALALIQQLDPIMQTHLSINSVVLCDDLDFNTCKPCSVTASTHDLLEVPQRESSSESSVLDQGEFPSVCQPKRQEDGSILVSDNRNLYHDLTGMGDAPILFGWWPKPQSWNRTELSERTTRCLPAVRPGKDLVALPQLDEVQELWNCWASAHALASWQVVWFEPRLIHSSEGDSAAVATLREVMDALPHIPEPAEPLCFYPMYLTPEIDEISQQYGIRTIGDRSDHVLGALSSAKAWLHPHINPDKRGPSLRDVRTGSARGPMGYIASSVQELLRAFHTLKAETPNGTGFVLKPSWASGGDGIVLNVTEEQIQQFEFPGEMECTAILEEFIRAGDSFGSSQSPTLYMMGDSSCGPAADQILTGGGAVNLGNRWPSQLPVEINQACVQMAQEVNNFWGLKSQWGLDFVLDEQDTPIVVDLNMGRPNGNFSVRLWESRFSQRLHLHTANWKVPKDVRAEEVFNKLASMGLAWNVEDMSGVIMYQHLPDMESGYVVASASGWSQVQDLITRLDTLLESLSRATMRP